MLVDIIRHRSILLLQSYRCLDSRYLRDEILHLLLVLQVTRAAAVERIQNC